MFLLRLASEMCGAIVFHSPLSSTILKNQKESWKVQILNFIVAFLFDLLISQTNRKLKLANNGAASIRFLKVEPWILSPRYQFQDVNHFAFLSWERFPVDRKLHHQIRPHHKVTFSQARGTMPLWLVQAPLHFVFPDLQISVLAQQTDGNSRHLVQQEISSNTSQPIFVVNYHGFSNQPVSLETQAENIGMESSRLSPSFHCDHVSPIAFRRLSLQLLPVKPSFNGALEKCWEMPFFSLKTKTFEKNKQQISLCFFCATKQLENN